MRPPPAYSGSPSSKRGAESRASRNTWGRSPSSTGSTGGARLYAFSLPVSIRRPRPDGRSRTCQASLVCPNGRRRRNAGARVRQGEGRKPTTPARVDEIRVSHGDRPKAEESADNLGREHEVGVQVVGGEATAVQMQWYCRVPTHVASLQHDEKSIDGMPVRFCESGCIRDRYVIILPNVDRTRQGKLDRKFLLASVR